MLISGRGLSLKSLLKSWQLWMFLLILIELLSQLPFFLFLSISILSLLLNQSSLFSLSSFPLASPPSLLSLF